MSLSRDRSVIGLFVLALAILVCSVACHSPERRDNIILITLDTTRVDALGLYGNSLINTPVLDQWGAKGHVFSRCFTHAPITLPSHASILTGLTPYEHGVRNNIAYALDQSHTTLPEILSDKGYATGAFIGSIILLERFGLGQGFDHYDDEIVHYSSKKEDKTIITRRAEEVVDHALEWIGKQDKPFFSWLHFYDPHFPYDPPAPFQQAYPDHPYYGELAYVDFQLKRLANYLQENNLEENTLIVITGDHGEAFGEHGESTHGFFCYNATTHVPLILSKPIYGAPGEVFHHEVQSIDLMPSILDWLGIDQPGPLQGHRLDQRNPRELYAEAIIPNEDFYCAPVHRIRDGSHQFYYSSDLELYDLENDPKEQNNLATERPELTERLRHRVEILLARSETKQKEVALDAETIELLRSLGYIHDGGTFVPDGKEAFRYPSPKNSIKLYRQGQYAREFEHTFPFKMIEVLEDLVEAFPDHPWVFRELGRMKAFANNESEAIAHLRRAATLRVGDPRLHTYLGLAYHRFGHPQKSLEEFRVALELNPDHAIARYNAGVVLLEQEDIGPAEENFNHALRINPKDIFSLNNLAVIYRDYHQDLEKARQTIQQAIELRPNHPLLMANLQRIEQRLGSQTH